MSQRFLFRMSQCHAGTCTIECWDRYAGKEYEKQEPQASACERTSSLKVCKGSQLSLQLVWFSHHYWVLGLHLECQKIREKTPEIIGESLLTLPKVNIHPEKWWLERLLSYSERNFSRAMLNFRGDMPLRRRVIRHRFNVASLVGGCFKYFWNFHSDLLGNDPIWRAYFWNWLKPPTRLSFFAFSGFRGPSQKKALEKSSVFQHFWSPKGAMNQGDVLLRPKKS